MALIIPTGISFRVCDSPTPRIPPKSNSLLRKSLWLSPNPMYNHLPCSVHIDCEMYVIRFQSMRIVQWKAFEDGHFQTNLRCSSNCAFKKRNDAFHVAHLDNLHFTAELRRHSE